MSKATDSELNKLHELLAKVFVSQLSVTEKVEIQGELQDLYTAQPALLTAAARFLKDNHITCEVETDENLTQLQDLLASKKKRGKATLASVSPIDAARNGTEDK